MSSKRLIICLGIGFIFMTCHNENKPLEDKTLNELYTLMQGSYNSKAQSIADSSYYNISLHMYPIWKERGKFLYVEQALHNMQDQPYRQRVYELKRSSDSTFNSLVYTFKTDSLWVGQWKHPDAFDALTIKDLDLKQGCNVILKKVGPSHFQGSTNEKSCKSSLRGATYATSQVELFEGKIISWDRGFNAEDKQVWGAQNGGYIFEKIN